MKFALKYSFTCLLVCCFLFGNSQSSCSLDPAWNGDGRLVADGSKIAEHIIALDNGQVLVACNPFGDSYAYLRRYNADGSQDLSFGTNGKFTVQVAERRTDIDDMRLHNGKIYLCGSTTTDIGGTNTYVYAAALDENGTAYDAGFGTAGVKKFNSGLSDFYTASAIKIGPDGKLYMAGLEWLDNLYVVRMSLNGTLDPTWDLDGRAFVQTGNANHWFELNDMAIGDDGKVVVAGKKYKANNGSSITPFWNLLTIRFNTNGSLDNGFASGGIGLFNSNPTDFNEANSISIGPGGSYVLTGNTYDGQDYDYTALKLDASGSPDLTFGNGGWSVNDLEAANRMEYSLSGMLLSDGRVMITGNEGSGDTVYFSILMLNPDGSRDLNFAPNGLFKHIFNQNNNSSSSGMALSQDGRIVLGGYTRTCANGVCGPLYMALSRYFGGTPMVAISAPIQDEMHFYPNPIHAGGLLRLDAEEQFEEIEMMDLSGKAWTLKGAGNAFQLPELPKGLYLIRTMSQPGEAAFKILVD